MLENHKRLYQELAFLKLMGEHNVLETILLKEFPDSNNKYSQDNILEFHRFLLLENIKDIVIKIEKEASGNS